LAHPSAEAFERFALPHAEAALALARALVRVDADAEDVVQEAYVRAFKYFGSFSGTSPRAWLLAIVRNAAYALLRRQGPLVPVADFDDQTAAPWASGELPLTPEAALLGAVDAAQVRAALGGLPVEFREVVVLRELEQCSYKEIAEIAHVPIGTVMSRLSRGRRLLHAALAQVPREGPPS